MDDDAPAAACAAVETAPLDAPLIEAAISSFNKPSCPTADDLLLHWQSAMDQADAFLRAGREERAVGAIVVAVLWQTGFPLAKNREALRVAYWRKRERWLQDSRPSALADKRKESNRERRWELPDSDRLTLGRYYLNCDLSSAWRLALKNNVLSPETAARFSADPSDKSRVPHSIRDGMKTDLLLIDQWRIGPRDAKLVGGWIERRPLWL